MSRTHKYSQLRITIFDNWSLVQTWEKSDVYANASLSLSRVSVMSAVYTEIAQTSIGTLPASRLGDVTNAGTPDVMT